DWPEPGVTLIVEVPLFSRTLPTVWVEEAVPLPRKLTVPPLRIRPLALPRRLVLLMPVLSRARVPPWLTMRFGEDSSAPLPLRVSVRPLAVVLPLTVVLPL